MASVESAKPVPSVPSVSMEAMLTEDKAVRATMDECREMAELKYGKFTIACDLEASFLFLVGGLVSGIKYRYRSEFGWKNIEVKPSLELGAAADLGTLQASVLKVLCREYTAVNSSFHSYPRLRLHTPEAFAALGGEEILLAILPNNCDLEVTIWRGYTAVQIMTSAC